MSTKVDLNLNGVELRKTDSGWQYLIEGVWNNPDAWGYASGAFSPFSGSGIDKLLDEIKRIQCGHDKQAQEIERLEAVLVAAEYNNVPFIKNGSIEQCKSLGTAVAQLSKDLVEERDALKAELSQLKSRQSGVVLPERRDFSPQSDAEWGWNACLDEVFCLNPAEDWPKEQCPVTGAVTDVDPADLPGMWEPSDLSGGATDCESAACKSLGEHHPFCGYVKQLNPAEQLNKAQGAVAVVGYAADFEGQQGNVITNLFLTNATFRRCPPDFGEPRELMTVAQHERIVAALAAPPSIPETSVVVGRACWLANSHVIHRYLMSCAHGRWDGAEKAQRHAELCAFYVALDKGCDPEFSRRDYKREYSAIHEATQALTDNLDTEIGFPLNGMPDYDRLAPLFFAKFHAIALRAILSSKGGEE